MKNLLCVLMFGMVFGQTELTTKVYELDRIDFINNGWPSNYEIDLNQITGENLSYAQISIININLCKIKTRATLLSHFCTFTPNNILCTERQITENCEKIM